MKLLLVTEKCSQNQNERDGGARLVETLQKSFGGSLKIMQFGPESDPSAAWYFCYPFNQANRFERRLANGRFIAEQIKRVEDHFTHVIFVHVSMQFGLIDLPLKEGIKVWTFPMFLTPSYMASGEVVPERYIEVERLALAHSKNILTPSHLEKRQLIEFYSLPEDCIHVVPRGIKTHLIEPKVRFLVGPPIFCSVGSIKPQKNTLGLLRLFAKVLKRHLDAKLRIIGPVQNGDYYREVCSEVHRLGLAKNVEFLGFIPPDKLSLFIQDSHLHLSTSMCETFGRSIFETLACGLPNTARKTGNAAAEFLEHVPYARFFDNEEEALNSIDEMLANLPELSSMALEIADLYDDELLSKLLVAKICHREVLAISDFDGTLYHKTDPEKTLRSIEAFRKFPLRILCSARPIDDLLTQLELYQLEVDWIVASGGAIVTDGFGKPLWISSLDPRDVALIERLSSETKRVEFQGKVLQMAIPAEPLPKISGLRLEIYQGIAYMNNWQASKLRAVNRLLRNIQWSGRVYAFGDGIYDAEFLTYFDGTLITEKEEITYV